MSDEAIPIPGIRGLHHVALVVRDLDAALERYLAQTGARVDVRRQLVDQAVDAASVDLGNAHVELIAPLDGDSGVARFLEKRGEGFHHVAYEVADIDAALGALRSGGARLVDDVPRAGLHGTPIAFIHPASTGGVLTELVQAPGEEADHG